MLITGDRQLSHNDKVSITEQATAAQVTSLALCKVNKSEMFLRRLSQRVRHERTHDLFWKTHDVPHEALEILKACPLLAVCCTLSSISFDCVQPQAGGPRKPVGEPMKPQC